MTIEKIAEVIKQNDNHGSFTYQSHGLECPLVIFQSSDTIGSINMEIAGVNKFLTRYKDFKTFKGAIKFIANLNDVEVSE